MKRIRERNLGIGQVYRDMNLVDDEALRWPLDAKMEAAGHRCAADQRQAYLANRCRDPWFKLGDNF